jgi:MarR family transcriptional regulator, transcriptional regulator for hemolysin
MDPLRIFGFLLKDVSRLSSRNFERHAVDLGLTLPQCKVLVYLSRNEGINQIRLAYLTDTDPMTLVRILDRMEQDGWVERRQGAEDRRERRLYATARAAPVVERIWAIADRSRAEALAGLSAAERAQLVGLLERIHGNLAALVPGAVEPEREPLPLSTRAKPPRTRAKSARKSI